MPPPPPSPPAHDAIDPAILAALIVLGAIGVSAAAFMQRRFPAVRFPTLAESAGTVTCAGRGVPRWLRQTLLLAYRAAFLGWFLVVDSFLWAAMPFFGGPKPTHEWIFFTVWNFNLQILFFAAASLTVLVELCVRPVTAPDGCCRRALSGCTHRLFTVCLPSSMLVALVQWTLLYPSDLAAGTAANDLSVTSFTAHGINTLALLGELCLDRYVVRAAHLLYPLGWAGIYCIFTWVQHSQTQLWPYFFMRLDTPAALGWYSLVIVAYLLAFGAAVGLSRLKAHMMALPIDGPVVGAVVGTASTTIDVAPLVRVHIAKPQGNVDETGMPSSDDHQYVKS